MTKAVQQFVEMVREISIRCYCEACNAERTHYLIAESRTCEVYKCAECSNQKSYMVR